MAPVLKKGVDFCFYIDPSNDRSEPQQTTTSGNAWGDAPVVAAALRLRTTLDRAINHTSYEGLRNRPVALAIESKEPSQGLDGATLQMGVWLSAHWAFLRHLNKLIRSRAAAGAGDASGTNLDAEAGLLPDFLPGIIIIGHDWHLILTTVQGEHGENMILWRKLTLGSTSSPLGVYQIVCALQILRQWAEATYWPWLRERVLRF